MRDWHTKLGYDSCWSPAGANGIREENCIADPKARVQIVEAILGDTRQAQAMGFSVDSQTRRIKLDPERAAAALAAGDARGQYLTPQQVKAAQRKAVCKTATLLVLLNLFIDAMTGSQEGFWPCHERPAVGDQLMIHDDRGNCAETRFGQIGELIVDSTICSEGDRDSDCPEQPPTCAEMCNSLGCGADCFLCVGTGAGQPGNSCSGCSRSRQPSTLNSELRCLGRDDQTLQVRFEDGETCTFSTADVYCYGQPS